MQLSKWIRNKWQKIVCSEKKTSAPAFNEKTKQELTNLLDAQRQYESSRTYNADGQIVRRSFSENISEGYRMKTTVDEQGPQLVLTVEHIRSHANAQSKSSAAQLAEERLLNENVWGIDKNQHGVRYDKRVEELTQAGVIVPRS
jgi:hypothetical protein